MKTWDGAWEAATVEQAKSVRKYAPWSKGRNSLRGDRNQCPACGQFFNSSNAFDSHRYGKYGNAGAHRKCLTPDEMKGKGFVRNGDFYWVANPMKGYLSLPESEESPSMSL